MTGKTFTDTEKNKTEKFYPFSNWDCRIAIRQPSNKDVQITEFETPLNANRPPFSLFSGSLGVLCIPIGGDTHDIISDMSSMVCWGCSVSRAQKTRLPGHCYSLQLVGV